MRNFTKQLSIFFLFIVLPFSSFAQKNQPDVKFKTIRVTENIFMLAGVGGNIGLFKGPDGVLMIDTNYARFSAKIEKAIKSLGGNLKFILNTHVHGDHTGGNSHFSKFAPIISHSKVRERLLKPATRPGREAKPAGEVSLPMLTFENEVSLHLNGEEVKFIHMPPGHTDGDTVVFFTKSNVVHMGDLYFARMFPFIDLRNGGNVDGFIQNIGTLLKKIPKDAKIIPGHGPLSTHADLKKYYSMLVETTKVIRAEIKKGKDLENIKGRGLLKKWNSWEWQFITSDRWIEIVYHDWKEKH